MVLGELPQHGGQPGVVGAWRRGGGSREWGTGLGSPTFPLPEPQTGLPPGLPLPTMPMAKMEL